MLTLMQAFNNLFREDRSVVDAVKRANNCFWGDYKCHCEEVLEGNFTLSNQIWPVSLDRYDLAVEWMDPHGLRYGVFKPEEKKGRFDWIADESEEDRKAFAIVRSAEAVVRDRFNRLLAPLREGAQAAHGHLASGTGAGLEINISKGIWNRPSTRIDFINGELHRLEDDRVVTVPGWHERTARRVETLAREWTGVLVAPPIHSAAEKSPPIHVEEIPERSKGGREATYPWAPAFDRLVLEVGRKGLPETGAELAKMMMQCLEREGFDGPNEQYVKQVLRKDHPILWEACRQPSRSPAPRPKGG